MRSTPREPPVLASVLLIRARRRAFFGGAILARSGSPAEGIAPRRSARAKDGRARRVGRGVPDRVAGQRDPHADGGIELMQRVFVIDVLECPRCRGRMRIIAEIHPPGPTSSILGHLGLPTRAPPPRPAPRELILDDDMPAA